MGEEIDDVKGRVKEAAGDLGDDARLKREGQVDRAGARIKEIIEEAKSMVEDAVEKLNVDRARARTKEVFDEAKAKADEVVDALKSRLRAD